jgi:hypothetical protein
MRNTGSERGAQAEVEVVGGTAGGREGVLDIPQR